MNGRTKIMVCERCVVSTRSILADIVSDSADGHLTVGQESRGHVHTEDKTVIKFTLCH